MSAQGDQKGSGDDPEVEDAEVSSGNRDAARCVNLDEHAAAKSSAATVAGSSGRRGESLVRLLTAGDPESAVPLVAPLCPSAPVSCLESGGCVLLTGLLACPSG